MQYWIGVLTIVGIYMIAVLGVSILCGFTGMFSMGHAGFMAIGGYVSALLTKNCGMPIFVGILGGMLAASLVGYLISYPTLRLRDDYFIIVTLGIGEAGIDHRRCARFFRCAERLKRICGLGRRDPDRDRTAVVYQLQARTQLHCRAGG